jgi:hypothetical protein
LWAPQTSFLWRLLQHQKLACPFGIRILVQCSRVLLSSPVIFFLRGVDSRSTLFFHSNFYRPLLRSNDKRTRLCRADILFTHDKPLRSSSHQSFGCAPLDWTFFAALHTAILPCLGSDL